MSIAYYARDRKRQTDPVHYSVLDPRPELGNLVTGQTWWIVEDAFHGRDPSPTEIPSPSEVPSPTAFGWVISFIVLEAVHPQRRPTGRIGDGLCHLK